MLTNQPMHQVNPTVIQVKCTNSYWYKHRRFSKAVIQIAGHGINASKQNYDEYARPGIQLDEHWHWTYCLLAMSLEQKGPCPTLRKHQSQRFIDVTTGTKKKPL